MKPPFFRLGRSRLNGIISPPYPEVTLDTFGFPVGGRLAAWQAVSWPRLTKVALLGSKNAFFYAAPMKPPFLWLGRSRLNGMTTPPYPEGTLDTLGFLVGGRLAIRRAVSWPWLHKVALLGSKNATFLARNQFFVVSLKINCYNHNGTHKRQLWLYTLNCHNISKRFAAGCYFERASTNLVDFLDKQIIILVCSWLRRAGNASQGVSIYFIILTFSSSSFCHTRKRLYTVNFVDLSQK